MKPARPFLIVLALMAPLAVYLGCYATTGPVPTCAQDPTQSWCFHPLTDSTRPDAGQGDAR